MAKPLQSPPGGADDRYARPSLRVWAPGLSFYPFIAVCSVYGCWLMYEVLRMPGAVIGSWDSPMGVAFNISASFTIGLPSFLLWTPCGFMASFCVVRPTIFGNRSLLRYMPVFYIASCTAAVFLVRLDPGGVFEWYFD